MSATDARSSENFWLKIERDLQINVPIHIKHVFMFNGLDNPDSLCEFDDDSLTEIEGSVKSSEYKSQIPESESLNNYFADYIENTKSFKFSADERKIIDNIVEFTKSRKGFFWKEISLKQKFFDSSLSLLSLVKNTFVHSKSTFMSMLVRADHKNCTKDKRGFRFQEPLKLFCSFLYMIGGSILYETLHANLPIPSLSAIKYFISHEKAPVVEGMLRVNDLKKFLVERNYPLFIYISEDATRIIKRVQYDSKTNQCVGFVLPINSNSMPISYAFEATSEKAIRDYFSDSKNTMSTSLYVFIVQPMAKDAPLFCLSLFGTDNTFTYSDTLKRWDYIKKILKSNGIDVLSYGSDGDPRLLKSMLIKSEIGKETLESESNKKKGRPTKKARLESPDSKEFSTLINEGYDAKISSEMDSTYIQDPVHVANKIRNRLQDPSRSFPLGNYVASMGHIKLLVERTTKDKHCLTEKDVTIKDKMNFASTVRISHPRVRRLLQEKVPLISKGTQIILKIIYFSYQAFLNVNLNILQRIYCIWFCVYFLRMWRRWLASNSSYSVQYHFISINSYCCIEINAHNFINLILKCLKHNLIDHLFPWQLGSQACENFFKMLRTMSTTHSTVVNFTLLESINRVQRLHMQSEILNYPFSDNDEKINFPRTKFITPSLDKKKDVIDDIEAFKDSINIETILNAMISAKKDAIEEISELGIDANKLDPNHVMLDIIDLKDEDIVDDFFADEDRDIGIGRTETEFESEDAIYVPSFEEELDLREHSEETFKKKDEKSPVMEVTIEGGKTQIVHKSSYCWLMNQEFFKLSSDRLNKFQQVQKLQFKKPSNRVKSAIKLDRIYIGDWCLFRIPNDTKCLLGIVLSFAYTGERKLKDIAYSSNYAEVEGNSKTIGVLCNWFSIGETREVIVEEMETHGYLDIKQYYIHIPQPTYEEGNMYITEDTFNSIRDHV